MTDAPDLKRLRALGETHDLCLVGCFPADLLWLLDEIERLKGVIRRTHDDHCDRTDPDRAKSGWHSPACLLYEIDEGCVHIFEANPGMYDSSDRYCLRCGVLEP